MNLRHLLVSCFFISLFIQQANADEIPWHKLQGLGQVEYFELVNEKKQKAKTKYHIFVRLPDEYLGTTTQQFPVLYLLDGGTNFPLFAANYTHLRWMEDIPPMIIVGISYGTHDWREGNDRSHDFTVPSSERAHWGGAEVFEHFLVEKLMVDMAKRYRVKRDKQILYGQSLGGQFGLYSSMYGNAPFYGIIASNPALHRNLDYFRRTLTVRKDRPRVFVSMAEFDDKKYQVPARQWVKHWQNQPASWDYKIVKLPGHNHLSATPDALRNGLMWMFQ